MSCRALAPPPRAAERLRLGDLIDRLRELARAGRREDFCWLAGSRGVPAERAEVLWKAFARCPLP